MSGNPRVTIASASWYPVEGGAERQLREVARLLNASGWRFSVVAGGNRPAPNESDDMPVHRILSKVHQSRDAPAIGLELMVATTVAIERSQPDLVLASLVSGATLGAAVYARWAGVPMVLRIGGFGLHRMSSSRHGRKLAKFLVRSSSVIVVNADHLRRQVDGLLSPLGPPVVTIRNGVGVPEANSKANSRRTGRTRVLYYTNGTAAKNDVEFERIVAAAPGVAFRAVGSVDTLRMQPNLEVCGWRDDLGADFAWCDVVLNTSIKEGSPNFCLQALASRRPVIGYDNEGVRDLHRLYAADVALIPMNDTVALCNALYEAEWRSHRVTAEVPRLAEVAQQWQTVLNDQLNIAQRRGGRRA